MEDDEPVIPTGQVITPETVTSRTFTSAFRGYHPAEVRQFLKRVSDELAAGAGREVELRRALQDALTRAAHPDLDESTVTTALGEHAARLITSARETAASITGEATKRADALLRDAEGRVARMRDEAEGLLARRMAEADSATDSVRRAADAEARRIIEEATQRGKEMVAEARDVRERMLADLGRRRRVAQTQIEQLRAARDRLLAAYDVVRRTVDEATDELEAAEPEARAAAEAVRRAPPVDDPALALAAAPSARSGSERTQAAAPSGSAVLRRVGPPPPVPPLPVAPAPPDRAPLRPQTVAGAAGRQVPPPPPPPSPPVAPPPPVPSELATGEVPAVTADAPPPANGNGHSNGNGNGHGRTDEAAGATQVESLFARIRAERVTPAPEPPPAPAPPAEPVPVPALAPDPVLAEHALATRDELLEDVEAGLTKALKRVLQDEQNAALDRLRRAGAAGLDGVLADAETQRNAYRDAALPWLERAARAGVTFASPSAPSESAPAVDGLDSQAGTLAADLAGPLRDRLTGALDADDPAAAGEGMRAVYRQWKVQHMEETARHHVAAAFNEGAFAVTPADVPVRWLVEDDGHCPDCDDNALAGPTPKGRPFPTGQLHPPAHPGCRCLLVPAPA